MNFLNGYKTYIGAGALFILGGLFGLNIISKDQFEALATIAGAWTAYGFRSAMK